MYNIIKENTMIYVGMVMVGVFIYGVVRFYDGLIRMMHNKIKDLDK